MRVSSSSVYPRLSNGQREVVIPRKLVFHKQSAPDPPSCNLQYQLDAFEAPYSTYLPTYLLTCLPIHSTTTVFIIRAS